MKKIDSKPCNFKKRVIKTRFGADNDLPLNKILKLHSVTIVFRYKFEENDKCYSQIFFRSMFMWVIKMLQYERIDVSEGIEINKWNKL